MVVSGQRYSGTGRQESEAYPLRAGSTAVDTAVVLIGLLDI